MSNIQNEIILENLVADNIGKLEEIFLSLGEVDGKPINKEDFEDDFNNWLADKSLDEICDMLNVSVDNPNQRYEDMKTMYE